MKTTIIAPNTHPIPPVSGGSIQQIIYETTAYIQNPSLTVISPWHPNLEACNIDFHNTFFHVDTTAQEAKIKNILKHPLPKSLTIPHLAQRFYYLNGVTDLLHKLAPDIIEVHNHPDFLPYLIKEFPQKQFTLFMHQEPSTRFYKEIQMGKLIHHLKHIIFVSHYLAKQFLKHYPFCHKKVSVIYNSIDPNVWHPNLTTHPKTRKIIQQYNLQPNRTLLFSGRIVRRKGLHCLLNALSIIRKTLPNIHLMIVGSPKFGESSHDPYLAELHKASGHMSENVTFTGYIDHKDMPYFLAASDIAIVPSIQSEGCPATVIESLATGTTTLASHMGGIPEILKNNYNGILINDPQNIPEFAKQIITLLTNTDHRRTLEKQGHLEVLAKYTHQIRCQSLQFLYQN